MSAVWLSPGAENEKDDVGSGLQCRNVHSKFSVNYTGCLFKKKKLYNGIPKVTVWRV
jgi:hypothetical protein